LTIEKKGISFLIVEDIEKNLSTPPFPFFISVVLNRGAAGPTGFLKNSRGAANF
jgi:hypothetical protein